MVLGQSALVFVDCQPCVQLLQALEKVSIKPIFPGVIVEDRVDLTIKRKGSFRLIGLCCPLEIEGKPHTQSTCVILDFLGASLEKANFNNLFYPVFQNVIIIKCN